MFADSAFSVGDRGSISKSKNQRVEKPTESYLLQVVCENLAGSFSALPLFKLNSLGDRLDKAIAFGYQHSCTGNAGRDSLQGS